MAQLVLNSLTKSFEGAGRAAVNEVSLAVRDGGFLALLGPSGCGKTTVLRMIAGFEQPTGGNITLGDRILAGDGRMVPPEQRNMAMVFQSYALWPHMTVADNVGYPLKVRGFRGDTLKRKVMAALETVRLQSYAERRPADLSGGQRQRVALARCLVTEPDVVLLDEPLANLDRHLREEMEETFREFHRQSGATMVYVTHDQAEAMALATDVAVMSDGRLLQMASPEDIYARPEGCVVGGLIGQGAILSLRLPSAEVRLFDWATLRALLAADRMSGSCDVLVRPQDVEIVAEGQQGLPATVSSVLFEGERYALTLHLSDGQMLRAFARRPVVAGQRIGVIIQSGWRL